MACLISCHGASAPSSRPDAPREATVRKGDLVDRVLLTGELHPPKTGSVELGVPKTDHEVSIRWLAEDGGTVKAGDKVIELDNSAFTEGLEQKHITAIEAALTASNTAALAAISFADKEAEVKQDEIALAKAKLLADVPADLLPAHDAQQRQLDLHRAETTLAKAKRDLAAQRESDALELHVKELERDKAKRAVDTAEDSIKQLTILAPRDGTFVVEIIPWEGRKLQVGDTVWPGFTIGTMPDLTQALEVEADLSDVDDGRVKTGMVGTCTLDAYPADPLPCTVSDVAPVARDKNKKSLRRTFAVVLAIGRNDPTRQRPGMSVKVELHAPAATGVVLVPRGAIVDGKRVRMASGELRDVTLGKCDEQACAVDKGVAEGDKVLQ